MTEGGLTTCVADSTTEQVENTVGVGLPGLELRTLDADMKLGLTVPANSSCAGPACSTATTASPNCTPST